MNSHKAITIKPFRSREKFGSQLASLVHLCEELSKGRYKKLLFDFRDIDFMRPFFALPFCALIAKLKKEGISIEFANIQPEIGSYLRAIFFADGYKPEEHEDWEADISRYRDKNYIPIINFPTERGLEKSVVRDKFLGLIKELIAYQINLKGQLKNGVLYIISEMIDNIVEHSQEDRGWIFVQYYPQNGFMDLCIADSGITLYGAYKSVDYYPQLSDIEAIDYALMGKSTKKEQETRGYGISTTRNMLVNGLKGKFVLISGKGLAYNLEIKKLPARWPGTILALRLPNEVEGFAYTDFIE